MKSKIKTILLIIFVLLCINFSISIPNNKISHSTNHPIDHHTKFENSLLLNAQSREWNFNVMDSFRSVAISGDGNYIAGGGNDTYVYFFSKNNNTPLWSNDFKSKVRSVAISYNGSYLVVGCDNGGVSLFNTSNGTLLWNYTTNNIVRSIDISSDGNYIAVASDDNKTYFFNKTITTPKTPEWTYESTGFGSGQYQYVQMDHILLLDAIMDEYIYLISLTLL